MVPEEVPVTSPTFVIMNQYHGRLTLSHFDLYRLSGADDLDDIGLDEALGRGGVSLVEWPEQCGIDIPSLRVRFTLLDPGKRALDVRASDPFHRQLLLKWKGASEDVKPQ